MHAVPDVRQETQKEQEAEEAGYQHVHKGEAHADLEGMCAPVFVDREEEAPTVEVEGAFAPLARGQVQVQRLRDKDFGEVLVANLDHAVRLPVFLVVVFTQALELAGYGLHGVPL